MLSKRECWEFQKVSRQTGVIQNFDSDQVLSWFNELSSVLKKRENINIIKHLNPCKFYSFNTMFHFQTKFQNRIGIEINQINI